MSDPNQALAAAAAEIADLKAKFAQTLSDLADARGTIDGEKAKTAAALADKTTLTSELATMKNDLQVLQAKWNEANAPVEPGITRGPPAFVTTHDGTSHATLRGARMHLVRLTLSLTAQQAQDLVDKATDVIPIIDRIAGRTE